MLMVVICRNERDTLGDHRTVVSPCHLHGSVVTVETITVAFTIFQYYYNPQLSEKRSINFKILL